jgi:hypothetical protein
MQQTALLVRVLFRIVHPHGTEHQTAHCLLRPAYFINP